MDNRFAETVSNVLPLGGGSTTFRLMTRAYLDVAVRHGAPLATPRRRIAKKACRAGRRQDFQGLEAGSVLSCPQCENSYSAICQSEHHYLDSALLSSLRSFSVSSNFRITCWVAL